MANNSRQKWIDSGYELFAKEGQEGILVERLARILNLNKSSFYYYFRNPENFITELLTHHRQVARLVAEEIKLCETLDPDYFKMIEKYSHFALVQARLGWKPGNTVFHSALIDVRETVDKPLLPLWRNMFNLPDNPELVQRHLALFRNIFYEQANLDHITYEYLHDMFKETHAVMQAVYNQEKVFEMVLNGSNK